MLSEKPLVADFKQENEILKILPRLPLVTSHGFGWHGIEVQQHRQPTWETPEHHFPAQHTLIVVSPTNYATQAKRSLGTLQKDEQIAGKVAILPAQVPHKSSWAGESDFTLLMLESSFLAHIAHESVNVDLVELLPTFAKHDPIIHQIGSLLQTELESESTNSRLYVDGLTTALSAHLLSQYCTVQQTLREYQGGLPKYKLQQVIDYIQAHLAEDISLEEISNELSMSRYYFCRLFKQNMGISPYQYVIQCRIDRAKDLLLQGRNSIAEVALLVGFTSQSHFTKHFKRLVGVTPKQLFN